MRLQISILFTPLALSIGIAFGIGSPKSSHVRNGVGSLWEDVASPLVSGQNHERHRGSAWCDYDNDGLIDLYLSHFGERTDGVLVGSPNQLLRNVGNGKFEEVTTDELAVGSDLSHHSAWADLDNDGLPDLFVGQSTNFGQDRNHLLIHSELGEFVDVAQEDPLAMFWMSPRAVSWQDINNDGFVDLAIANSGGDNQQNWIMINQGNGTFVRENNELNQMWREGRGIAWSDYNNDGLADMYITNGSQDELPMAWRKNGLFRNNGDGTWSDVAIEAGVADIGHGRGVAWGDINNDGFMDVLVGNSLGVDHPAHNRLFRNNGDGTFTDITESAGIFEDKRTRCVSMADYDNDGLIDLYVVSFGTANRNNRLFHNNGNETFTNTAIGTLAEAVNNDESATWADFDNDGWIDLYTVGGSTTAPGVGQNQLLRNVNQNGNHWFEIELCGTTSNRSAIGARVSIAHRDSFDNIVNQMREVQSGNGYNSQHMQRAHFGLGSSTVIDELQVRWPSGITQTVDNIYVDQMIRVVEDEFGIAFDCNRNCVDDIADISQGVSSDVNQNSVPDECECISDIDGNGQVDVSDLLSIIGSWGETSPPDGDPLPTDLDGSHTVDVQDLLIAISDWGDC